MQKMIISLIIAFVGTAPAFSVPRTEANCKESMDKAIGLVHQYVEGTMANPKGRKEAEDVLKGQLERNESQYCKAVENKVPTTSKMARDIVNKWLVQFIGVGNFTQEDLLD